MNKRIVVTGATGMIGSSIIAEYLKHDVEKIYAVIRPGSANLSRVPNDSRIQLVEIELSDYSALKSHIPEKCDAFFHLAWDGTGMSRDKSTAGQAQNIVYTLEALKAAADIGCHCFIGAGSQAEYGLTDADRISEDCVTKPVTAYGIAKLAAGQLSILEAGKLGIDCFWVRVFSVYGALDKSSSMVSTAVRKLINGEKTSFTPALQRWDYLHSSDAARAFYMIAEKSKGRKVYNMGSGQARQLKDYIYAIRDIIDPSAEPGIGDIPYKGTEVMNLCADISALREDTGWTPVIPFEDGIKQMVDELSRDRAKS